MLGSITVSTYILLLLSSVVGMFIGIVGVLLWDLHKSRKTVEEPPTSPDPDYPEYDPTSEDHDERMSFEFDEIEREYMASIMEDHERGAQMMGLSFEESNTWAKAPGWNMPRRQVINIDKNVKNTRCTGGRLRILEDEPTVTKLFAMLDEYNAQIPDSVRNNQAAFSELDAIFYTLDSKLYVDTNLDDAERTVIINHWADR